jgi:hypothetical protein
VGRHITVVVTAILVALLSGEARAAVIFSNLGPGDSFNSNTGWGVHGIDELNFQDVAIPFTVSGGDWRFTSVEVALDGSSLPLDFLLMTDAGGIPGAVIETLTLPFSGYDTLTTGSSLLMPTLHSGTTYWIATDTHLGSFDVWLLTDPEVVDPIAFSFDLGTTWTARTDVQRALRVHGDLLSVPEPSGWLLLGGGAAALSFWRRCHLAARAS